MGPVDKAEQQRWGPPEAERGAQRRGNPGREGSCTEPVGASGEDPTPQEARRAQRSGSHTTEGRGGAETAEGRRPSVLEPFWLGGIPTNTTEIGVETTDPPVVGEASWRHPLKRKSRVSGGQ
ncbi:hypothetical protein NDU88_005184 [Pleurodeles waltl]|uniref:Uncharacterized protein n=1 Tax=Pleurodeles waltl TaxID=8319 RepID=A0AAV7RJF7_PLEWA|nr:hypothetical protein NDU88_005184 [Pleurodeles waltl]